MHEEIFLKNNSWTNIRWLGIYGSGSFYFWSL